MLCQREIGVVGLVAVVALALLMVLPVAAQKNVAPDSAPADVAPDSAPADEAAPDADPKKDQPPGLMGNPMILIIGMGLLFYFIVLAPQKKERRKREAMISSLQKHDRVVTAGGIVGTVVSVDEGRDLVVLEVDRDTQLQFLRRSIQGPMGPDSDGEGKSSGDDSGD
ncbi:MAG: preprotein translocase subunit YajC [Planctomycetaceae bacterium]|nr:preprotein translocase subunit YajC [Planctomycetaceae bacterium]